MGSPPKPIGTGDDAGGTSEKGSFSAGAPEDDGGTRDEAEVTKEVEGLFGRKLDEPDVPVAEVEVVNGDGDDKDGPEGAASVAFDVLSDVESGAIADEADVNTETEERRVDGIALENGAALAFFSSVKFISTAGVLLGTRAGIAVVDETVPVAKFHPIGTSSAIPLLRAHSLSTAASFPPLSTSSWSPSPSGSIPNLFGRRPAEGSCVSRDRVRGARRDETGRAELADLGGTVEAVKGMKALEERD